MSQEKRHPLPKKMNLSTVFNKNAAALKSGKRLIMNQGGTSSTKTYSILQLFTLIAISTKVPLLISVMSESLPHLKLGCIRDFKNKILGDVFNEDNYNYTDNIYYFYPGKGAIEFFSANNPSKVHGPRRDYLFVNEVNNISKDILDNACIRTDIATIVDYNPVSEFYLLNEIGQPGVEYIHSTYLDGKNYLPKAVVDDIESRRDKDPNWWRVYGLGEIGNVQGLVHPIFKTINQMPDVGSGIEFYGLDFGYSPDPTALIRCIIQNDNLYCDELIYETGLNNNELAKKMLSLGIKKAYDEIYADTDRLNIDEVKLYGLNVKPAPKGPGSVLPGIQKVNQYNQYWTERSIHAIKEQRNYRFIETSDGVITSKPIDSMNHAMDARRYGVMGKVNSKQPFIYVG